MQMPGRQNTGITNNEQYRFNYNGMEVDNEVSGNGNSYTTEFRQYDPRLGRWKSLDPLMAIQPFQSPYQAFNNNPIYFIDPSGLIGGPAADKGGIGKEGGKFGKTFENRMIQDAKNVFVGDDKIIGSVSYSYDRKSDVATYSYRRDNEDGSNERVQFRVQNVVKSNWAKGVGAYDVPFKEAIDLMVYDGTLDDPTIYGEVITESMLNHLKDTYDPDRDGIVKYPPVSYERVYRKLEMERKAYEAYNASGHCIPVYFELDLLLLFNGIPSIRGIRGIKAVLPNSGPIIQSVGAASRSEMLAKKLNLNLNSPTTRQALNSLDETVESFISKYRKASVRSEMPGKYLNMTVEDALKSKNSTVRKLLIDGRFAK